MVSALGNTAVAAVSIFSQPRMVILCVTRSYSVALSAYVARRRGKHPDESLTSCSRASLMLGCGLSMLERGVSSAEAAVETGFSDQSHFTNYFTAFTGLTPGACRELFRQEWERG